MPREVTGDARIDAHWIASDFWGIGCELGVLVRAKAITAALAACPSPLEAILDKASNFACTARALASAVF
jgi:hypothetical protein